ncbi:unnamed protein product [Bemisia tabaci]|uniref:RNA helicase n=1 Tax=Bemisia tabaci TaxID=7038 RepID=A0A9P0EWY5_BEMTA|nr:unnamed protein product [Bemisia tabaci]
MGKNKKGYNWRARQLIDTKIVSRSKDEVQVSLNTEKEKFDSCNAFVLPSKKRNTIKKKEPQRTTSILSKAERKRLEKIVDKKKKKEYRAALLESLADYQASPDVLKKLVSVAKIQTKGLKKARNCNENLFDHKLLDTENEHSSNVNIISGSKKRKQLLTDYKEQKKKRLRHGANIVNFELSDSNDADFGSSNDEEARPCCETSPDQSKSQSETCAESFKTIFENKEVKKQVVNKENGEINKKVVDEDTETRNFGKGLMDSASEVKVKVEVASEGIAPVSKPAFYVPVERDEKIQASRLKLPILAEEQSIMETITENSITIICGETGSGKTTQIPQFLYEAGYGSNGQMIGVTEPRRVAAISMSKRVGMELNLSSDEVSYLIRFEGNTGPSTKIKFMTDGVLLKEIQSDFLLTKYSVIILDEAHERSIFTDILIGLLSRIVPLRSKRNNPLKLIIMSATLRIADYTENPRLFKKPPPVIHIESRQYPVVIHFNKRTSVDYVRESFSKACKIHCQLPEGGILIFLTGQQEVNTLVKKLRRTFPYKKTWNLENEEKIGDDEDCSASDGENVEMSLSKAIQEIRKSRKTVVKALPEINLDSYDLAPADDTEADMLDAEDEDIAETEGDSDEEWSSTVEAEFTARSSQPLWVLPLYSLLPSHKQARIFEPPPPGCRLCVVATNVAETSLTIPSIKYVVDCGRTKTRLYDNFTGISMFSVIWTSKASADQRAGRAGRIGPGHCYRLYSSALFKDEFEEFTMPEIQQKPVDDLLLQMKAMKIERAVNFPFPSAPNIIQLKAAERRLAILGALETSCAKDEWSSKLTPLGEAMALFPVAPRFGKMLCLSHQHCLLPYTIAIVAALSVQEVLLAENVNTAKVRRMWAGVGNSLLLGDVIVLLRAVGAAEYASSNGALGEFCLKNGLNKKAITEIRKLRKQVTNEMNLTIAELQLVVDPQMKPPSDLQAKLLRQVVLAGMVDHVALKLDQDQLTAAGLRPHQPAYRIPEMEDIVFMHSSSVLRKTRPQWVVYQEVYQLNDKMYMRGVTAIEPEWLPVFARSMCTISEPLEDPPPRYDAESDTLLCHVNATFGQSGWPLPVTEIEFPACTDKYRLIAMFLLDGTIIPSLQKNAPHLLSSPSCMTKSWASLQPRTNMLLKEIMTKDIDSRQKLKKIWDTDPLYLLEAYLRWLPESAHSDVRADWPPS